MHHDKYISDSVQNTDLLELVEAEDNQELAAVEFQQNLIDVDAPLDPDEVDDPDTIILFDQETNTYHRFPIQVLILYFSTGINVLFKK